MPSEKHESRKIKTFEERREAALKTGHYLKVVPRNGKVTLATNSLSIAGAEKYWEKTDSEKRPVNHDVIYVPAFRVVGKESEVRSFLESNKVSSSEIDKALSQAFTHENYKKEPFAKKFQKEIEASSRERGASRAAPVSVAVADLIEGWARHRKESRALVGNGAAGDKGSSSRSMSLSDRIAEAMKNGNRVEISGLKENGRTGTRILSAKESDKKLTLDRFDNSDTRFKHITFSKTANHEEVLNRFYAGLGMSAEDAAQQSREVARKIAAYVSQTEEAAPAKSSKKSKEEPRDQSKVTEKRARDEEDSQSTKSKGSTRSSTPPPKKVSKRKAKATSEDETNEF